MPFCQSLGFPSWWTKKPARGRCYKITPEITSLKGTKGMPCRRVKGKKGKWQDVPCTANNARVEEHTAQAPTGGSKPVPRPKPSQKPKPGSQSTPSTKTPGANPQPGSKTPSAKPTPLDKPTVDAGVGPGGKTPGMIDPPVIDPVIDTEARDARGCARSVGPEAGLAKRLVGPVRACHRATGVGAWRSLFVVCGAGVSSTAAFASQACAVFHGGTGGSLGGVRYAARARRVAA